MFRKKEVKDEKGNIVATVFEEITIEEILNEVENLKTKIRNVEEKLTKLSTPSTL